MVALDEQHLRDGFSDLVEGRRIAADLLPCGGGRGAGRTLRLSASTVNLVWVLRSDALEAAILLWMSTVHSLQLPCGVSPGRWHRCGM